MKIAICLARIDPPELPLLRPLGRSESRRSTNREVLQWRERREAGGEAEIDVGSEGEGGREERRWEESHGIKRKAGGLDARSGVWYSLRYGGKCCGSVSSEYFLR